MSKGSVRIQDAKGGFVVRLLRLWYLVELGSDEGSLTVFVAWEGDGYAARRPGSVMDLILDLSLPWTWFVFDGRRRGGKESSRACYSSTAVA